MTVNPGTRLGPYEVVSWLGAGGMGEVYKARDTRLDRAVALKVIAGLAAGDPELRHRFEREARTISQLSHPNICALYDVGTHDGVEFLVMELIEGETLADRLARDALDVEPALRTAIEIAEALAAAHRRGIVHRDLKPGNVMLTKAGCKLLDFGLAKVAPPSAAPAVTMMPTTPANLTAQGTILGTFQYMSPEQLEGREADARSDIFAFGALLYEVLTGRRAFEAKSQAGLISAILTAEPPRATALQPLAPAGIDYVVSRCLAKDPDDRWQSARDLAAELRRVTGASHGTDRSAASGVSQAPAAAASRPRVSLPGALAAVMTLVALVLSLWIVMLRRPAASAGELHLAIPVIPAEDLAGRFALSRDGSQLAFVAQRSGRTHVFLRPLHKPEAAALASPPSVSTGGPAFSPDGKWVAFTGGTRLWKVSVDGGGAVALTGDVNSATGRPTWANGRVVFENAQRGLSAIAADGGDVQVLTRTQPGELQHFAPWLALDGKTLFFTIRGTASDWDSGLQLVAMRTDTGERKVLTDGTDAIYLESGHLLFLRHGTVFLAPFSVEELRITGDVKPVVQNVAVDLGLSMFTASQTGSIAYLDARNGGVGEGFMTLVDTRGAATQLKLPSHRYADPRLSPDGERALVHLFEEGRENYIADLKRGTLMRLTFDAGEDETPIWSPDGRSVVYTSTRDDSARAIFRRNADGTGSEERLWSGQGHIHLGGFTPDGRTIVLAVSTAQEFSLATFTIGDKELKPLVANRYNISSPALSPDGRWLAYTSDETGRSEVYVQPYPTLNARWPVSAAGGEQPVWSRNGRQLFFRSGGKMMGVDVTAGDRFVASAPAALFDDRYLSTMGSHHTCFDTSPDGQFLMVARAQGGVDLPNHINLIFGLAEARLAR